MSYKSILVHLDLSASARPRLEFALHLAKQFDAHLTGLLTVFRPEPGSFYVMAGTADYFAEVEAMRAERRTALERFFKAEIAREKVVGEWKFSEGYANRLVPEEARLADLTIVGQRNPEDAESFVAEQFIENLLLSAGRPVLVLPYAVEFASVGENVLFAWDGSREATRALHDALPFLTRAKQVVVLTVNALKAEAPTSRIPGSDIANVIARHGVNVVTEEMEGVRDVPIGELLLSRAADFGTDLIVMGGYGHSRWREIVLGGATRAILKAMTVPVLMTH
ncbi:universal stress protein [Trinickia sp. EG282A]|uniref:universal stress protein n=1 Tax=Trinickia sp. EG282A TaxID=3237013 RepID=UPI0034D181C0